jgi:hypothetical protein
MGADVAILVPVMRRPQNVLRMLSSLDESGCADRCTIYFIADADDELELDELQRCSANVIVNHSELRTFAVKCNLGYRETDEPWMLLVGDDVRFGMHWVDDAFAEDDGSSLISTNDMLNRGVMRGLHATHPLIRRSWADQRGASWDGAGTVCHDGYRHWYVDNEWTAVAQYDREFRYAPEAIVEHLHPLAGKGHDDEVYRLGQSHAAADRALYLQRLGRFANAR